MMKVAFRRWRAESRRWIRLRRIRQPSGVTTQACSTLATDGRGASSRTSWTTAELIVTQGDITTLDVDAVVDAANSALAPGGGVCGATHRAAGPRLNPKIRESAWSTG